LRNLKKKKHHTMQDQQDYLDERAERRDSVVSLGKSPPRMDQPRTMSTTEIDLESVLNLRRRRLSVTATQASQDSHRYTDVIFLKVEKSNELLREDARCIVHGDYHVISDIFQKYTSQIKIHHDDPELVKCHDRLSGKLYCTVELPTMTLIEVLEILHKHYFSIIANSTNFGPKTNLQEFILLRNKDTQDRSLPIIDTTSKGLPH